MTDQPLFVLVIRAEPGVDPMLSLRALLKVMLRGFGLRCLKVRHVVLRSKP
jgi:hypothetical protein